MTKSFERILQTNMLVCISTPVISIYDNFLYDIQYKYGYRYEYDYKYITLYMSIFNIK